MRSSWTEAYRPVITYFTSEGTIMTTDTLRNVVLVHGGFVDGSGWQGVYESLTRDGFRVGIVQNPTLSLEGDAAATRWVLDAQDDRPCWSATPTAAPSSPRRAPTRTS